MNKKNRFHLRVKRSDKEVERCLLYIFMYMKDDQMWPPSTHGPSENFENNCNTTVWEGCVFDRF